MPNRSILDLSANTTPALTDLCYLAKKSPLGLFYDRKVSLSVLKNFIYLSKTIKKGSSYLILSSDCDKRWISNQGALASVFLTLPEAAEGLEIGFFVEEARQVQVIAGGADKIGSYVTYTSSEPGASLYLKGSSGFWIIVSSSGTWTAT